MNAPRIWLTVLWLCACHQSTESEPNAATEHEAPTQSSGDGGQRPASGGSGEDASSDRDGGRGGTGGSSDDEQGGAGGSTDRAGSGGAGGGAGDAAAGGEDAASAGAGAGGDGSATTGCIGAPAICDDGNACTVDVCNPVDGECVHNAKSCDDGNACTVDACSPADGVCGHTTASCDDGNACTADACDPAAGCGHAPVVCDDHNVCTDDACTPGQGCVVTPNTASCDDDDACTDGDVCAAGVCRGTARSCADGNPCTTDSCATGGVCVHANNTARCDDGNSCTTGDRCGGGSCRPGNDDACGEGQLSCTPGVPNACVCEEGYDARDGHCLIDVSIPEVEGNCPLFRDSTITFMGLGGIRMVAGPKPAGPTAPIVFYWHGTGSVAAEYETMATAVYQGVVAEGGVLISFQGTTGGDYCSGTAIFGAGDMELVDQLVACAVRDHNVDRRRIYTTGCSAGGLFATCLAVRRSGYIAAVAPNSGGLVSPQPFQTDDTPALMTIHGEPGRDVVIVDFSNTSALADMEFRERGGFVINCNHGGTHCGGGALAPHVWEFFKAHPFGINPSPYAEGLPAGFPDFCTIIE